MLLELDHHRWDQSVVVVEQDGALDLDHAPCPGYLPECAAQCLANGHIDCANRHHFHPPLRQPVDTQGIIF